MVLGHNHILCRLARRIERCNVQPEFSRRLDVRVAGRDGNDLLSCTLMDQGKKRVEDEDGADDVDVVELMKRGCYVLGIVAAA